VTATRIGSAEAARRRYRSTKPWRFVVKKSVEGSDQPEWEANHKEQLRGCSEELRRSLITFAGEADSNDNGSCIQ
jgi:hypothetical protein